MRRGPARQPFYDTLIDNVEAGVGVRQLERDSRRYGEFVLDTYWKRLQPRARWYHARRAAPGHAARQLQRH